MAPEIGEIRLIEQLAAGDEPSREGAWWIMLQTAESVCNCASLRDPVNNAFLSEFWTDATKHVTPLIESKAERPLPYDDLMQMVSYCGDQLQMIITNPRHNIEKVDKMVMPQRVKNTGSKTMNWLGRQPGKTIKEKLAGKNKMLTQINAYSYDIRENQVSMMLYHQIMHRVSDRVNYGINVGGYDDTNSEQLMQLYRIKKLLRNSPLADINAKNHNQANNALLSDKNYSVIWRAYLDMAKYDKRLAKQWKTALQMYAKAVFLAFNAEILSYEDVYAVENRIKLEGLGDLKNAYVIGYHCRIPYVIEVEYSGNTIALDMYDALLDGINQSKAEMHLTLTIAECTDSNKLEARHGIPINVIVEDVKKADIQLFADFSGIRSICAFLVNKVFLFADIDKEKRQQEAEHIEGSIAFDIVANGDLLGIEELDEPVIPSFGSKYAVSYLDENGNISVFPSGNRGIHYNADKTTTIDDAVFNQNNEGLRMALEDIHNKVILNRDDYFFYLVPDALEEIMQKNLKQCVRSWFSRTFPVWRSVAALTFWLNNPEYTFDEDSIFAYLDLVGDTATVGMMTIHSEKTVNGYVCNHFPPFPQIDEGDDITEDAYCRNYVLMYAEKYGFSIPEDVVTQFIRSGSIKELMIRDSYANQFVESDGKTIVYQITYDEELVSECIDKWLNQIKKFWKKIYGRFDSSKRPNHVIFLSDILINVLYQLKRESDLYTVFNKHEQEYISLYQSSSDEILQGALIYKERLNKHLPTWTEYLPHLSLEVIKDGDYVEIELIGDDVSFDVMGDDNEHIIEERLLLKANEKEFSFPLVKQDISRKSTMIDAYIADRSFPLDHDVEVALFVRYKYGYDNSYELTLKPVNERESAFKEIVVEWANTDRKSNILNIWPPETNRLPDDIVLQTIEEAKDSFSKIQSSIEKHMVNYVSYNDKSYPIKQTDRFLNRNIFKLRNIVLSDLPQAREFMQWFIDQPLYRYIGQIAGIFVHEDIDDSFFDDNAGEQMSYFIGDCLQVMFSIGRYTPQDIQDSFVKRYKDFSDKTRMKAMIDMLLRNGTNRAAIGVIIDEIRNARNKDTYNRLIYSLVRELGRMCCFDSDLVYAFYDANPSFMREITNYTIKEIRSMLNCCEKQGDSYTPDGKKIKKYVSYMVALLSFLRLRNPDRADGFNLLAVGSDDSKKLAREIRALDNYMTKERPINPAIRFKLNKPESLSKMSDLSYALDLYLNGDKQAASIEVVGVDEDD